MHKYILIGIFLLGFSEKCFTQNCPPDTTGFIPLYDLTTDRYLGFSGGKYPNGLNDIPKQHFEEGITSAGKVQPLNTFGETDLDNGKIGFLILGYSTAAMTGRFVKSIYESQTDNKQLEIIIGAQGGLDLNAMIDTNEKYWLSVDSILQTKQTSSEQIQLIWLSTGDIKTYKNSFPEQCYLQIEKYKQVLQLIKTRYPNIKIVFLSDRTYAGYIGENANGPKELMEPTAYYSGWTIKWLIEKQIKSELGYTADSIPFIDWGPSLWTDGTKGNKKGYTWNCDDAAKGGIHSSSKGRMKEAALVFLYFKNHPYTKQLFGN